MKRKIRNEKVRKWLARKARTRRACASARHPVVTVYRSARHIYAQLIDPATGRTLGSVSTRQASLRSEGPGGTVEAAKRVGRALAELAREQRIEQVVLNRNGFLYHGRVKALADAAREAGLKL
jgi:large subunit ribosomal protein L18